MPGPNGQRSWNLTGFNVTTDPIGDELIQDTLGNTYWYGTNGDGYCFCADGNQWYYYSNDQKNEFVSATANANFSLDNLGNALWDHNGGSQFKYSAQMDMSTFTDKNGKQVYLYTDFAWGTAENEWFANEVRVFPYMDMDINDQEVSKEELSGDISTTSDLTLTQG
jgi:hypothetical protein